MHWEGEEYKRAYMQRQPARGTTLCNRTFPLVDLRSPSEQGHVVNSDDVLAAIHTPAAVARVRGSTDRLRHSRLNSQYHTREDAATDRLRHGTERKQRHWDAKVLQRRN